ncbi:MAG: hypothetical protein LC749_06660, partial [Actinobacteria bacterium]|nr:hypothetical protein [Actinomycetota bacterium]
DTDRRQDLRGLPRGRGARLHERGGRLEFPDELCGLFDGEHGLDGPIRDNRLRRGDHLGGLEHAPHEA